ncbi:MAG: putative two-component transcription regulator and sensor protein [Rhodocyclales bacterium]|nr:putative two-component transcription regulator and sensor protein [Rhodocyclales bacterium]
MQSTVMEDTENLLHVMAARTPTLTRLSDEQGVCRFFNEAWGKFTGRSNEEESGSGWLRAVHTDDRAGVNTAFRDATAAQADVEIQYRLRRRDGVYRWMLDRASPWRRADGSFGGLVSACTDVTSLKAPRTTTNTEAPAVRLPSVLTGFDAQGRLEFVSSGMEALLGIDATAAIGKHLHEINLPETASHAFSELLRSGVSGIGDSSGTAPREVEFALRVGERQHHLVASALPDGTQGVLIVTQDITSCIEAHALHRDSLQREELSRQKAEAASRARDQFLSVVSHELRSPLNGIQSWAHVLESQIDTSKPIVQRALAGIKTGVTQQVGLIEALLDATQILNGQLNLLPQAYSLNGAIQAVVDNLSAEAVQKEISVSFTPELADIDMHGDVERVQQIIRHLLSNAIKFTHDGGDIQIGVSRQGGMAVVSVEDNGNGIAPGFVASLFEPFRQVDSSQTRRAAGLGLGLAVSRRIAELSGGSLQCESEGIGHGSTFRVFLPLPH